MVEEDAQGVTEGIGGIKTEKGHNYEDKKNVCVCVCVCARARA